MEEKKKMLTAISDLADQDAYQFAVEDLEKTMTMASLYDPDPNPNPNLEQIKVVRSGATMAVASMADSTDRPPITSSQKLLPRINKLSPCFLDKASVASSSSSPSQKLAKTSNRNSTSESEENQRWNAKFFKEHGTKKRVRKEINETEPCSKIYYHKTPDKEEKFMLWEVGEKTPMDELFAENWKKTSGSVRNQRSHDNCSIYAATDLFSNWRLVNRKDDEFRTFSARYLTFYSSKMLRWLESTEGKRKDTHHCHGNSVASTLKFIKENGVPEEDPADAEKDFSCITDAPEENPPNMYKIPEDVEIRVSNKLEDLYEMLLHQSVAADLHYFHPEFTDIGSDDYEGPTSEKSIYAGVHCVLITAVKRIKGKLVALVKSSHGKKKGKKGHMKVSLTKMILGIGRGNDITSPSFLLTNFTCLVTPRRALHKPKSDKETKKRRLGSCPLPSLPAIDSETLVQRLQLLVEASCQDKKFFCEEEALNTMVNSVARLPLLRKLQTYVCHRNPHVRAKAAVFTSNCVSKMELSEIEEFGMVLIVQMAADLLSDKLPEAREAARSMVDSVYEKFTWNGEEKDEQGNKQEAWQKFCEKNVTGPNAQAMIKIVSSL